MAVEDRDFAQWRATGDPLALARVFDHTAPKLLVLASHWTRDGAAAEDLVQTTFLQAMRDGAQWRAGQPVLAWLLGILQHRATDLRRREARRATDALPEGGGPGREPAPPQAAIDAETRARIVAAVDGLGSPYRDVLILRLLHGLEPTAIAHALGREPATVRKQFERGVELLRGLLPASVGAALALLVCSGTGLGAMRVHVLASAAGCAATVAGTAPLATAALTAGGMTMKKTTLLAAAALAAVAAFTWRFVATPPVPPTHAGEGPVTLTASPTLAEDSSPATANDEAVTRAPAIDAASIAVRIRVTARGKPAAQTRIELQWFEGAGADGPAASAHGLTTDGEGIATWQGAATPSLRTVRVQRVGDDHLLWCTPVVVAPDEHVVDLVATVMWLPCTLRGTVRAVDGTPIADATVSLNASPGIRTGDDGTYTLRAGTGDDERPVIAWAEGFVETMLSPDLPDGTTTRTLDFTLRPGARIAGRVVDAAGNPVVGAEVRASGAVGRCTTDAEGRFAWTTIAPGTRHQLQASTPEAGSGTALAEAGGAEVELHLTPGPDLDVFVHDTSGRPVPFAKVACYGQQSGMQTRGYTDARGHLRLRDLQPGPVDMLVHRRAFATHLARVLVQAGENEARIVLAGGKTVRGRVLDPHGRGLAGVSVYAAIDREGLPHSVGVSTHTTADGAFAVVDLPAEPCTLKAYLRGFRAGALPLVGPADAEVVVRLEPSATVTGRVLDARTREPVREFTLQVRAAGLRNDARGLTTADGRWQHTASALAPGAKVEVDVRAAGYAPAHRTATAEVEARPDACLVLLEPGAELAGVVLDAVSGEPIANAHVMLATPTRGAGTPATTDAAGHFRLRDLTPGPLSVEVKKPGYPVAVHGPFEARVGGGAAVDVRLGRGATVRGRVVGFPGSGWSLWAYGIGTDADSTDFGVGDDGSFTLRGLGRGRNQLYLGRSGDGSVSASWTLEVADQDLEALELRAPAGDGSLHVTVRGVAAGVARLALRTGATGSLSAGEHHRRFTDGQFTFPSLPEGPCTLTVVAGERRVEREVTISGATTLELAIE